MARANSRILAQGYISKVVKGTIADNPYGLTPADQRFDQVAAYIAALRLEQVQKGGDVNYQIYSVASGDRFLAEYRHCMSVYFEKRDRA